MSENTENVNEQANAEGPNFGIQRIYERFVLGT